MSDSDSKPSGSKLCTNPVRKLQLDENIAAYLEKRLLVRDKHIAVCYKDNYIESIVTNYVIAKQILSHLNWQEQMLYKHVCTTWHSAVNALRREQLRPVDFSLKHNHIKQSSTFSNEPLAVITFINIPEFPNTINCKNILPRCCDPPCDNDHLAVDVIHKLTTAPKECMIGVKAPYVTYMPLPHSRTIVNKMTSGLAAPFIGGIYIPAIPNIRFHKINLKNIEDRNQKFCTIIDVIAIDQVIKGVLMFVSDKHFMNTVEDFTFLNHIKVVQPDIPYAMGGCICKDAVCDSSDINHLVNNKSAEALSDNLVSLGIFTIPKNLENESNFDMFSLIFKATDQDGHDSIAQFAKSVPRFEHSVCFMYGLLNQDFTLKFEQDAFRFFFPNTPLLGCYNVYSELGIDHPAKTTPESPEQKPKRFRSVSVSRLRKIHLCSMSFVYMGWGKVEFPKD